MNIAPKYHRQRLLLFLLEQAGGRLSKLDLQKLLFLYVEKSGRKHYAFVPYRFGSYSFLAAADLDLLETRGWITQSQNEVRLHASLGNFSWAKTSLERRAVRDWIAKNKKRGNQLIRDVYLQYPWYATRSEIKEKLLSPDKLELVKQAGCSKAPLKPTLFTIGYEGLFFEEFADKLMRNNVKLLCDVRRNPISRKFGFSKKSLATLLPKIGIRYEHLPELGIESESRRHLSLMSEYKVLFDQYRETLPDKKAGLDKIMSWLSRTKSIALTCFEKDPHHCHRHCISGLLEKKYGITVDHL